MSDQFDKYGFINRRRLLNVSRALLDAEDKKLRFDMAIFGLPNYADDATCGTPMCAMGHYAARGDLQNEFKIDRDTGELRYASGERFISVWDVAAAHFGINYEQCAELFESEGCGRAGTPKAAALYIEDFVRRNGEDT